MVGFLVIRLLRMAVTLVVTLALVFFLLRVIPSDPAAELLRDDATPEQVAYVRTLWGLDQPIPVQFWVYVQNLLHGDAGMSYQYQYAPGAGGTPAFALVAQRFPATLQLAAVSLIFSLGVAIPLGIITALRQDTFLDSAVTTFVLMIGSLPGFWVGLLLIVTFALNLKLLPTGGSLTPQSIILPAATLALHFGVILIRLTRTEMARVMRADYIVTAYSKGLSARMVVWAHALRNAMIPIVAVTGLRLGTLLHGSVIVETVFAWPGIGRLMIESIVARDYPVIQVVVPISALIFVLTNFVVDVIYAWMDPRLRTVST
jgi:peptide/nickel transport system permease protein